MTNEPFHILLADDDEADRLLFKVAFSELEIKTIVSTVNNGVELMAYLNSTENPLPYLLFLDLNMLPKNGLESLIEIKKNKKLKDIFIAIYSTSSSDKDIAETFRNGANIYITKPYDYDKLKQVLGRAVKTAYQYKDEVMHEENFVLKI